MKERETGSEGESERVGWREGEGGGVGGGRGREGWR